MLTHMHKCERESGDMTCVADVVDIVEMTSVIQRV